MKNNVFKLVALAVCLVLVASVGFADKGKEASPSRATPVKEKLKESDLREQPQPEPAVITPAQRSPKTHQPTSVKKAVEPQQIKVQSASVAWDKGRQIKWQILSSGGACGSGTRAYWLGLPDGCILCGTVGQLAVGPGSSESFGVNSGFWQDVGEGFLRGDCNRDGVIDLGDVLYIVSYLYKGGPAPDPLWTGDCNCDEAIDLGDLLHLVAYLYKGGPAPSCP